MSLFFVELSKHQCLYSLCKREANSYRNKFKREIPECVKFALNEGKKLIQRQTDVRRNFKASNLASFQPYLEMIEKSDDNLKKSILCLIENRSTKYIKKNIDQNRKFRSVKKELFVLMKSISRKTEGSRNSLIKKSDELLLINEDLESGSLTSDILLSKEDCLIQRISNSIFEPSQKTKSVKFLLEVLSVASFTAAFFILYAFPFMPQSLEGIYKLLNIFPVKTNEEILFNDNIAFTSEGLDETPFLNPFVDDSLPQSSEISEIVFQDQSKYVEEVLFNNSTDVTPEGLKKICFFTSYAHGTSSERSEIAEIAVQNQRRYAIRHGYDYSVYEENLASDSLPYWSKIAGIRNYLSGIVQSCPNPDWIVWLDDDAIVTNPDIKMDEFIQGHMPEDSSLLSPNVLVTEDVGGPSSVNTGVLIVKNSESSKSFFEKLWSMRHNPSTSVPSYSYSSCPNQICLHEQEAMQDLLKKEGSSVYGVKVIAQCDERNIQNTGINTFERVSHIDLERGRELIYEDAPKNKFKSGDFIAQCTGLATVGIPLSDRSKPPGNLRLECMQKLEQISRSIFSGLTY